MCEFHANEKIILPVKEVVSEFTTATGSLLSDHDLSELLTQIVMALLNDNRIWLFRIDYTRLIASGQFTVPQKELLDIETDKLAKGLEFITKQYQLYRKEEFPYFFWKFYEGDIILVRLPF
jgi:hypothetical protein